MSRWNSFWTSPVVRELLKVCSPRTCPWLTLCLVNKCHSDRVNQLNFGYFILWKVLLLSLLQASSRSIAEQFVALLSPECNLSQGYSATVSWYVHTSSSFHGDQKMLCWHCKMSYIAFWISTSQHFSVEHPLKASQISPVTCQVARGLLKTYLLFNCHS